MNKPLLWLLLGLLLVGSGCASRYKITLTNGNVLTTKTKPRLDKASGAFLFKDAEGKPDSMPAFRVREIEPL